MAAFNGPPRAGSVFHRSCSRQIHNLAGAYARRAPTCASTRTYITSCMYIHAYLSLSLHAYICICVYFVSVHIYIEKNTRVYIYIYNTNVHDRKVVCIYAIHAYVFTKIHQYTYMRTGVRTCVDCVGGHTHVRVCTCVCTYIHPNRRCRPKTINAIPNLEALETYILVLSTLRDG